jgi:hypothetical protein
MSYLVCFNILFYPSTKLHNFVSILLFLYLDFSPYFQRLMLFTKNQVLKFIEIQLLHVDFFLSSTLRMIKLITAIMVTLDAGSTPDISTDQTSLFKPFFVNVFDAFDVYLSVLLFEVALGHPNSADIVNPYEAANRLLSGVGGLKKVIIVRLVILGKILFLGFEVVAFLRVLVIPRVGLLEQGILDVDRSPLECSSSDIAKRTQDIYPRRTEGTTHLANPTVGGNLRQAYAALVQTDVAHRAEDDQVIFGVVTISAYLALGVFDLHFSLLLLQNIFAVQALLFVGFLLLFSHVSHELFFFGVDLVDEL